MSKYTVKITRTEIMTREVEIEAEDAEAAKEAVCENDMRGVYDNLFEDGRTDEINTEYAVTDHEDYWYDWQILTEADHRAVSRDSARRRWGYSLADLNKEFANFKKAMLNGDRHTTSMICARLEDCNYHTICGKLADGDLAGAKEAAESIYAA